MISLKRKRIPRHAAMAAIPVKAGTVSLEELANDGRRITVMCDAPGWMGWFGAKTRYQRSYNLDYLGVQVYDACDGQTDVESIIKEFAERNGFSAAEAELSVTVFLKSMVAKGLIAMSFEAKSG